MVIGRRIKNKIWCLTPNYCLRGAPDTQIVVSPTSRRHCKFSKKGEKEMKTKNNLSQCQQ